MRARATLRGGDAHKTFLQLISSESCLVIDENIRKELIAQHIEALYISYGQGYRAGRIVEQKEQTNGTI